MYFYLSFSTAGWPSHRPFDLWGYFELENDGSLDLRKVKKQWGLDSVSVSCIDHSCDSMFNFLPTRLSPPRGIYMSQNIRTF